MPRLPDGWVPLLVALTIAAPSAAPSEQSAGNGLVFQQVEPGLEFGTGRLDGPGGAVRITAVRVSLRTHRIGLAVPLAGERGKTLGEFQRITAAKAALSGGFMTSFIPPIPLGFVKNNGIVVNRPASGDLLTGGLALKNGRPAIKPWNRFEPAQWDGGLQSGPLLVDGGVSTLPTATALQPSTKAIIDKAAARAAIAITDDAFVMLVTEPVALAPLATFVTRQFGPRTAALNLSGGNMAGLIVSAGNRHETVGRATLSLANAIVVDGAKR